jgi:protease I
MAKALIVIPHDRFRDEEFTAVYNALKEAGQEITVASTHHTEAQGHFGLLVKPDVNIGFVGPRDYEAMIFIGGRGIEEFILDSATQDLIGTAHSEGCLVCAIGMAVELLAYSGILNDKKVTCDTGTIPLVESSGGYYSGGYVEVDGSVITASGIRAKDEFAQTLTEELKSRDKRRASLTHA